MGTTSNGKNWGENTGNVASGIFYGWAAKRGIEAAQRRGTKEGDSDWDVPKEMAKVTGLWVGYAALWIIQSWYIVNATVITIAKFGDPVIGIVCLIYAVPAIVFTVMSMSASRALLARAEHLPPRKGEKYLALDWFPKKGWSMYLLTSVAYVPLYKTMMV